MFGIKGLGQKLLITAAVLIFMTVLTVFKMRCPILCVTGYPCLGCGMTRALLSALRFDFAAAFRHHPMFWSVPLLYLCFLRDGKLFEKKALNALVYSIIGIGFLFNWAKATVELCVF